VIWDAIVPFSSPPTSAIIPVTLFGFLLTGPIMQFLTEEPTASRFLPASRKPSDQR
jgi:hypothetical protein